MSYWSDLVSRLFTLKEDGYVKLPSISEFDLEKVALDIKNEMAENTFAELGSSHQSFLNDLGLESNLAPKLYEIAKSSLGYKGDISNQYHIARKVEPGNSKEMYRAHFDSHLFTLVLPIKIPSPSNGGTAGDLVYFPQARKSPSSEIKNFFEKASFKRYASKEGIEELSKKNIQITDDFNDYCPLLFIGNTTLHTNKPVTHDCSSYRLTLLAHFFDPSPKYGVGNLLRIIRRR